MLAFATDNRIAVFVVSLLRTRKMVEFEVLPVCELPAAVIAELSHSVVGPNPSAFAT